MKKTITITTTVEVEIKDDVLDKILPAFNEHMFDTDVDGLFAYIATNITKGDEWIEGVGEKGNTFEAIITNINVDVI